MLSPQLFCSRLLNSCSPPLITVCVYGSVYWSSPFFWTKCTSVLTVVDTGRRGPVSSNMSCTWWSQTTNVPPSYESVELLDRDHSNSSFSHWFTSFSLMSLVLQKKQLFYDFRFPISWTVHLLQQLSELLLPVFQLTVPVCVGWPTYMQSGLQQSQTGGPGSHLNPRRKQSFVSANCSHHPGTKCWPHSDTWKKLNNSVK